MSSKTHMKSSKTSPRKAAPAKAKAPSQKLISKSAKKATGKSNKIPSKVSHKPASKTLNPARPARSASAAKASPAKKPGTAKSSRTALSGAAKLAEGALAPAFELLRDGGETVSLADYRGQKLVIFFYPRANTPGCTKEAIDFTRLSQAFSASGTGVLGASADPVKAQESFRDKHQLKTPLASDETHKMLEAYGVWGEKSMYGKSFQGVLRTTVLIGEDGKVARIWRGVKVDGHADDVLAAARALL